MIDNERYARACMAQLYVEDAADALVDIMHAQGAARAYALLAELVHEAEQAENAAAAWLLQELFTKRELRLTDQPAGVISLRLEWADGSSVVVTATGARAE